MTTRLHLATAVLCGNSICQNPADVCQEIYDINDPCCPGCGSYTSHPISMWIPASSPPRQLMEDRREHAIPLLDVITEGSTDGTERDLASTTP